MGVATWISRRLLNFPTAQNKTMVADTKQPTGQHAPHSPLSSGAPATVWAALLAARLREEARLG